MRTEGAHALFECSKMCPNVLQRERERSVFVQMFENMRTYSFVRISFNMFFYIDL